MNFIIWLACEEEDFTPILKHYLEFKRRFLPKVTKFQFLSDPTDHILEAECPPNDQTLQTVAYLLIDGFRHLPDAMDYTCPSTFQDFKN